MHATSLQHARGRLSTVARPAMRLALASVAALTLFAPVPAARAQECPPLDYSYPLGRSTAFFRPPIGERAKDFAVVRKDGLYHLFYIRVDRALGDGAVGSERDFGHATSPDLVRWTQLAPVNPDGGYTGGVPDHPSWDTKHVWAPSIINVGTTYYMFFTGVDASDNQRIGVSTSTDLVNWTPFPNNPVFSCTNVSWAACPGTSQQFRDPFVMRDVASRDGTGVPGWLMYYTARTSIEYVIGLAWAPFSNPYSWQNLALGGSHIGQIFSTLSSHQESPHVIRRGGENILFTSGPNGLEYYQGYDPTSNFWYGPYPMKSFLGEGSISAGFPENWFASESISDGTNDHLLFVHDYDPAGPCDPYLNGHPTASAIEAKVLDWDFRDMPSMVRDVTVPVMDSHWDERCTATSPGARWGASMVYDAAADRMILFGGRSSASNGSGMVHYNDLWAYSMNSRTWTQLGSSGTPPAARSDHVAIYDAPRRRMVLVGGSGPGVSDNRQVFVLNLAGTPTWSTPTVVGSPGSQFYRLSGAYAPDRDQLVTADMFNGIRTLTLGSMTWGAVVNSLPGLPHDGTVTYDQAHHRALFFGGWDVATGGSQCPTPKTPSSLLYGLDLNAQNPGWTQLSTGPLPPRFLATAYCDPARNQLVVFGGTGFAQSCRCGMICGYVPVVSDVPYSDVWTMDLNTLVWSERVTHPTARPAGRSHHAAAFAPVHDELVVFGGGDYRDDDSQLNCMTVCTTVPSYRYRSDTWSFKPTTDVQAPAASVLNFTGGCYDHIYLDWTSPGDDRATGQAVAYDLRSSAAPITESNFYLASGVTLDAPLGPCTQEIRTIGTAYCGTTRYYALKTRDEAMNWSPMSNVVGGRPGCPRPPAMCYEFGARPPALDDALPQVALLDAPEPNPAPAGGSRIRFGVPASQGGEEFDVGVFDIAGRRIATLASGRATPGFHTIEWRGRSADGGRIGGGVFFVRFRIGAQSLTRRLIVLD